MKLKNRQYNIFVLISNLLFLISIMFLHNSWVGSFAYMAAVLFNLQNIFFRLGAE